MGRLSGDGCIAVKDYLIREDEVCRRLCIGRATAEAMDPRRDAALFLASVPAADGSMFTRFLIEHGRHAPVH